MCTSQDELELHELREWLTNEVLLERYYDKLTAHGFCSLALIRDLSEEDLDDVGVKPLYHRKRLLKFCNKLAIGEQPDAHGTLTQTGSTQLNENIPSTESDNPPSLGQSIRTTEVTKYGQDYNEAENCFEPPPLPPKVKQIQQHLNDIAKAKPCIPERASSLPRPLSPNEDTDIQMSAEAGSAMVTGPVDGMEVSCDGRCSPVGQVSSESRPLSALIEADSPAQCAVPVARRRTVSCSSTKNSSNQGGIARSKTVKSPPPPIPPRSDLDSDSQTCLKQFNETTSVEELRGTPDGAPVNGANGIVKPVRTDVNQDGSRSSTPSPPTIAARDPVVLQSGTSSELPKPQAREKPLPKERPVKPPRRQPKTTASSSNEPPKVHTQGQVIDEGSMTTTSEQLTCDEVFIYDNVDDPSQIKPIAGKGPTRQLSSRKPLPVPRVTKPQPPQRSSLSENKEQRSFRHSVSVPGKAFPVESPFMSELNSKLEKELSTTSKPMPVPRNQTKSLDRKNFAAVNGGNGRLSECVESEQEGGKPLETPPPVPVHHVDGSCIYEVTPDTRKDGAPVQAVNPNKDADDYECIQIPQWTDGQQIDNTYEMVGNSDSAPTNGSALIYEEVETKKRVPQPAATQVPIPDSKGRKGVHPSKFLSIFIGRGCKEPLEMGRKDGNGGEELTFDYESDDSVVDVLDEVDVALPTLQSDERKNLRMTSGFLYKQGGQQNNKGWRKRWFVFDGKTLKYYSNKESTTESLHIIPVTQMKNVEYVDDAKRARFNLVTANRVFMFASDSMTDMNLWAQTLMEVIIQSKTDESASKAGGVMSDPDKEGWLKKQGHNVVGDWKRRYVAIKGGKICYYDTYEDFVFDTPIHCLEGMLASVKPDSHKNRFQIHTPSKSFCFQAENESEAGLWIAAVQTAIQTALSDHCIIDSVCSNLSNKKCADCGKKDPVWACVNYCVCVCARCIGIHRNLGVSYSKPRSLLMDEKIWNPALVELMVKIGNENANTLLEHKIPDDDRITPESDNEKRKEFIYSKYKYRKYSKISREYGEPDALGKSLQQSVLTDDVMKTMELIINRVEVKYIPPDSEDQRTPFMLAQDAGKDLQAELLLQNGGDADETILSPLSPVDAPPTSEAICMPSVETFEKSGYLYRKEGSSMKKRWFTLKERQMKYYRGAGDKEHMGVIDLANVMSVTLHTNEDTKSLEIVTFDKTYTLKADTEEELESWYTAIKNKQVFQVHLSLQDLGSDGIPHLVANCLQFVETYGLQAEGIYRVSGSLAKIKTLSLAFNQDASHVMLTLDDYSVNDITGTLKKYLRELPEPVIPCKLYRRFIDVYRFQGHDKKLTTMKDLIGQLPKVNYDTLKRIIAHLTKVIAEQAVNRMGIENISMIFGPTLMSNENTGRMDDSSINQEFKTVGDMITFYKWLFDVDDKELEKDKRMEDAMKKITQLQEGASGSQNKEFTLDIYVKKKDDHPCLLKVAADMTADELCMNIVFQKGLPLENNWALFEVIGKGNLERAFQFREKVLPAVMSWGDLGELSRDNYLIIKENHIAENIQPYVGSSLTLEGHLHVRDPKRKDWKQSTVILKNGFMVVDKSKSFLRSITSDKSDADQWPLHKMVVYVGVVAEKQTKSVDTSCGFTVVVKTDLQGNIVRFLCAKDRNDLYRWVAAILSMKHPEGIWNDPTSKRESRHTSRGAQESQVYLGRQSRFLRREGSSRHIVEELRMKQKSLRRSTGQEA